MDFLKDLFYVVILLFLINKISFARFYKDEFSDSSAKLIWDVCSVVLPATALRILINNSLSNILYYEMKATFVRGLQFHMQIISYPYYVYTH